MYGQGGNYLPPLTASKGKEGFNCLHVMKLSITPTTCIIAARLGLPRQGAK
jgi:hypothetical protein